ncbi:hypothetical protein MO867_15660 [Microbulbifer sp. OS29]|uniref:Attractin/MKLN-like beta-propeller domain-containing protein n=1 Tax=Microbulbifer okhotskensis TaxID=2926617 RepID=A0A9X2J607_9GAMM|nr:kelch repeat-containing protein [Microbulbifer okhotskensis]MCO1335773.1 hypothetical protein [Microbulbifer okhotskensis]
MSINRRNFLKLTGMTPFILGGATIQAQQENSKLSITDLPKLRTPIQEIYPADFDGEIYVSGGFVTSTSPIFYGLSPSKNTRIFSPQYNVWKNGPELPEARHHLGMASNSKYLYGLGGFYGEKGNAWQVQDTVYQLSRDSRQWVSAPKLPQPMAESVYATIQENIHLLGGKSPNTPSSNTDTDRHFLLINNRHWESAAPASIKRNSAAGTAIDNRIYVIGGRQSNRSGYKARNLSFAEAYDPSLDKWEPIRPLPQALAGLTAAPLNGSIIVTGGEKFGPLGNWKTGTAFSTIWIYNPISDQWSTGGHMREARHGHGAVSIGSNLYIIGGAGKVGPQNTLASVVKLHWESKPAP